MPRDGPSWRPASASTEIGAPARRAAVAWPAIGLANPSERIPSVNVSEKRLNAVSTALVITARGSAANVLPKDARTERGAGERSSSST